MEDKINLHKRMLRVLIIASLIATACLIALNPAKAITEEINQINYFAIIGFSFYLLSLALLFFLNSWGKILFTIYVLEGLVARWYGPGYIEPAESLFLLFTYLCLLYTSPSPRD